MTQTQHPVKVSSFVAYYRIAPARGKWGRLERLTLPDDSLHALYEHAWNWIPGVQVEVVLSVFEAAGRLFIGDVQILTVPQAWEIPNSRPVTPPAVGALPIGTDILRALPLGALSAEAIKAAQDPEGLGQGLDDEAFERLHDLAAQNKEVKPQRGRRSNLSPEVLGIVRDAYLRGGRTGVKAVQDALQQAGFPGAGANGVTRDQAAKAVAAARRKGYLLPVERN